MTMPPSLDVIATHDDSEGTYANDSPLTEERSPDSPGHQRQTTNREIIPRPGPNDVLLGRGGGTNNHTGNIQFRKLINEYKMQYFSSSKVEKPKVARLVVEQWSKQSPPGRFLSRVDEGKKAKVALWYEVSDKKAREKASQCLRERTPEILPLLRQLREQQDNMTEQGVAMFQHTMKTLQAKEQEGSSSSDHPVAVTEAYTSAATTTTTTSPTTNGSQQSDAHQLQQQYQNHQTHSDNNLYEQQYHPTLNQRSNSMPVEQSTVGAASRRTSCPTLRDPASPFASRRSSLPATSDYTGVSGYGHQDTNSSSALDYSYGTSGTGEISELEYQRQMQVLLQRRAMMQQYQQYGRSFTQPTLVSSMTVFEDHAPSGSLDMSSSGLNGASGLIGGCASGLNGESGLNGASASGLDGTSASGLNGASSSGLNALSGLYESTLPSLPATITRTAPVRYDPNSTYTSESEDGDEDVDAHAPPVVDPLPLHAQLPPPEQPMPIEAERRSPKNNKRSSTATPSNKEDEGPTSTTPSPPRGSMDDLHEQAGELTIEEYRRQLEQYMNDNALDQGPEDDAESVLEDDWEKEKAKAAKAFSPDSKRGVGRNVSGISFMSTDTIKSNLSMMSGMSMLVDDAQSNSREKKMAHARSVGSNLSLMSELTDLSHNIDELRL